MVPEPGGCCNHYANERVVATGESNRTSRIVATFAGDLDGSNRAAVDDMLGARDCRCAVAHEERRSGAGIVRRPGRLLRSRLEAVTGTTEERATNKDTRLSDEEVEEAQEVQGVEDVEEALDVLLAARFSGGHADDFEEEEVDDHDIGLEGLADVVPLRQPDEFLCRACFLLKRTSQLADPSEQLCRDCA